MTFLIQILHNLGLSWKKGVFCGKNGHFRAKMDYYRLKMDYFLIQIDPSLDPNRTFIIDIFRKCRNLFKDIA